jgi:hypothetical protein
VTVLLDALDEAELADASAIASELLRPLADLPGVRVIVGTRPVARTADGGHGQLFPELDGPRTIFVELDRDANQQADIAEYARRRLLDLTGSVYAGRRDIAAAVAARIANHSAGIFLFARLHTRTLVLRGSMVDPASAELTDLLRGGVSDAFAADLRRYGPDESRLRALLRPLAWAEGGGLPRRDV